MKNYVVPFFVVLLAYIGSYAALVRPSISPYFAYFDSTCLSCGWRSYPDYRCQSLDPFLMQFYKPLHWADLKIRPGYWSFEGFQ